MGLPDVLGALIAYLKTDAAVVMQVQTRIYGGELPGSVALDANGNPLKCVLLQEAAGGFGAFQRSWVPMGNARYDVRCYGPTPFAAMEVWRAVYPVLKGMKRHVRGTVLLFDASPVIGASSLREPDTKWPFVFGSFNVLSGEEAVVA